MNISEYTNGMGSGQRFSPVLPGEADSASFFTAWQRPDPCVGGRGHPDEAYEGPGIPVRKKIRKGFEFWLFRSYLYKVPEMSVLFGVRK